MRRISSSSPSAAFTSWCWTAGQNERQSRVEYWLRMIQTFGGDSPVIVVCNKADQAPMDLDWKGLKEKYPQIRQFVTRVSCFAKENDDRRKGIDEVWEEIKQTVAYHTPLVNEPFPKTWRAVKDRLESDRRDQISPAEYENYCKDAGIDKVSERRTLLGHLHALGSVLYFGDDHAWLDDTVIRNPNWVTAAVYAVLNDEKLKDDKGVLVTARLPKILEEVKEYSYRRMGKFVLQLMDQFELSFAFSGEKGKVWIPDLSQKEKVAVGKWRRELRFRYQYRVLPQAIMSRFIVGMHQYLKSKESYWLNGAVLQHRKLHALVKADVEDGRIDVSLGTAKPSSEEERLEFLSKIRKEFERIHEPFADNLEVAEFVPAADDEFEKLSKLQEMWEAGETTIWIEGAGKREIEPILAKVMGVQVDHGRATLKHENQGEGGPSIFVSYRWAESSEKVDRLCAAANKRGVPIQRDREDIRVGGSIGDFMERLSRGERIVVFLGPEYLKNHSCVWELYHIWKNCGGRGEEFQNRIVAFVDPDLDIGRSIGRLNYQEPWIDEFQELDEIRKNRVAAGGGLGGEERHWQWMQEFRNHIPEMLEFLNDRLFPRDFEELANDDFEPLWSLLEV